MGSAPSKRDKNCYCEYHREHGHDTNEFRILKTEIEKLIKRGYLKEFIDKGDRRDFQNQNRRSPQRDNHLRIKNEPQEAPPVNGSIETIPGGKAGGGDSRNSRKMYARREFYSIADSKALSHTIHSVREVTLDFTVGKGTKVSTIRAQFMVVDLEDSSYNGLIGRPILTDLPAIVSSIHLKMNFPTPEGIGEISGDQKKAREEEDNSPKEKESEKKGKPHVEKVHFKDGKADKTFRIGTKEYEDVFAWGPEDMSWIDPAVVVHKLHVDPSFQPIKQKKLLFNDEKNKTIKEEISSNWHASRDEDKIVFITEYGLYCFKVMPFGLKNARATY
ncbi:hypothetical protein LIER_18177 [Lithospermum erythrorhizon]|uniref:Uncharacterized protein n=1 Tax=Lithospermum erythrorhizon TaxID=34254 RepID=A0AAV3QFM2_LITER